MITEKQKIQWGLTDEEVRCEGAGVTDYEFRAIYQTGPGIRKAGVFGPSIAWPGSCPGDIGRVPKRLAGTGKDDGGHLVGITFMGEAE
jgi:hypothetical protein